MQKTQGIGGVDMREKTIEQKFREAVRNAGGLALKFTSPGWDGMPDRLALLPGGRMAFVEVKAPGKKPRPLQLAFFHKAPQGRKSLQA